MKSALMFLALFAVQAHAESVFTGTVLEACANRDSRDGYSERGLGALKEDLRAKIDAKVPRREILRSHLTLKRAVANCAFEVVGHEASRRSFAGHFRLYSQLLQISRKAREAADKAGAECNDLIDNDASAIQSFECAIANIESMAAAHVVVRGGFSTTGLRWNPRLLLDGQRQIGRNYTRKISAVTDAPAAGAGDPASGTDSGISAAR